MARGNRPPSCLFFSPLKGVVPPSDHEKPQRAMPRDRVFAPGRRRRDKRQGFCKLRIPPLTHVLSAALKKSGWEALDG